MAKDTETVIADLFNVLASSELPKTEWPKVLRAAIDRVNSPAPSLPPRVHELFGDVPPPLQTKTYTKSDFPREWLDDPEVIRAANRILGAHRRKKSRVLEPEAMEKVRMARRIIRAHERRRGPAPGS